METAGLILAAWSAGIYAVIRVLQGSPLGEAAWWARVVPLAPLVLGAVSGPSLVPVLATQVEWLADVGPFAAVLIGIGAGAVAASGHSAKRQTIEGKDERIRRVGEGAGGVRNLKQRSE